MFKCINCSWKGKKEELTKRDRGAPLDDKCPVCGDNVKEINTTKSDKTSNLDFDINNDGKVDKEDITLIAKKLSSMRQKR